jgi:FtsH-binding integral membrane protein
LLPASTLKSDLESPLARVRDLDKSQFVSKIDGWLLVVLVGSALACLLAAGTMMISTAPGPWPLALVLIVIGCVLPVWLLVSTRYMLTARTLRIRSGPFRWRIELADIRSVTPTRNPLSSPALSLDRLRIDYGVKRWVMISPLEQGRFLRELEQRRMNLKQASLNAQ